MKTLWNANQKKYFDESQNQYPENLIINAPKHVLLETDKIYEAIKEKKYKICELGSGTGRLTIPLLKKGLKINAVDLSNTSLKKLMAIAKKLHIEKNLLIKNQLDKKETYKTIIGCDILHHIDLKSELPRIFRSLKKKGNIVFSEPNIINISWTLFITFVTKWQSEQKIFQCNYFYLKFILKKNRFTNIKIEGFGLLPLPFFNALPFLQKLNLFFGNLPLLKLFAYRLIISASK